MEISCFRFYNYDTKWRCLDGCQCVSNCAPKRRWSLRSEYPRVLSVPSAAAKSSLWFVTPTFFQTLRICSVGSKKYYLILPTESISSILYIISTIQIPTTLNGIDIAYSALPPVGPRWATSYKTKNSLTEIANLSTTTQHFRILCYISIKPSVSPVRDGAEVSGK